MVALVILLVILAIVCSRINPFLTSIIVSGAIGYFLTSFFVRFGAPAWLIPAGIVFWIVMAAPGIIAFLSTIVPPRRRKDV